MDDGSKNELTEYLDSAIRNWRSKFDNAQSETQKSASFPSVVSTDELIASCYVDAFQSVRISMIGSALPKKDD